MKTKLIACLLTLTVLTAVSHVRAADNSALPEPVKAVYTDYLVIQSALASDTLKGVSEKADAIAKAIKGDKEKTLPAEVAAQAEALAKADNLKTARAAFKPLSDSLIKYLDDHKIASSGYIQFYCPMARADWLQKSKDTSNPYFGKEMAECGVVKKKF